MAAPRFGARVFSPRFTLYHNELYANPLLAPGGPINTAGGFTNFVRHGNVRFINPKFKKERREKILKVELPDFEESRNAKKLTPDEMRLKLKEKGVVPPGPWSEKPMFLSCTGGVFEPYIPPEGDGKQSIISTEGAKQRLSLVEKKGKSMLALRKIRNFQDDFDVKKFCDDTFDIYTEVHKGLMNVQENEDRLHDLVTEKCYPELIHNTDRKTIRWQLLKSLEPPRVVHVRATHLMDKENVFAQVTVRFHTQQTLAIYDRFGRLIHGSEVVAKDVLEYIVFEKHLANEYGQWRIHAKIIPDWMPTREPMAKTFIKPMPSVNEEEQEVDSAPSSSEPSTSKEENPQLSTA